MIMVSVMFTFFAQNTYAIASFDDKPKAEVLIYPNPASNYLNINYTTNSDYTIVISNILGAVVHTTPIISRFENTTFLNLTDLNIQNGIYLVKVYEGENLKATQKLIVRK